MDESQTCHAHTDSFIVTEADQWLPGNRGGGREALKRVCKETWGDRDVLYPFVWLFTGV